MTKFRQKSSKAFLSIAFISVISPFLYSCAEAGEEISTGTTYVHVLNAEDYIDDSLMTQFEDLVKERDGKKVKIIYETYDTNETMYNTLKTGKQTYDMLCCSDYMIQRLAREGLLHSFTDGFENGLLDNYKNYVSPFLADYSDSAEKDAKLNQIIVEIPTGEKDSNGKPIYDSNYTLADYAVGYMWGTLGILYNPNLVVENNGNLFRQIPEYKDYSDEQLKEVVIKDFQGYDGYSKLWSPEYNKTQSIKDSMRDTYAVGIFELFKNEFMPNEDGNYKTSYHDRNELFNSCDDETIKKVQEQLIDLKGNIFGFEVDSGKDDIVTQKIAVNLAWSGDAVNSIGRGHYADDDWEEERAPEDEVELYYSIPKLGANVWFDAWCLPKHEDAYYTSDEYKYTLEFLDFLNDPESAVANMEYNGYTTFIGSASDELSVLEYTLDSFDLSNDCETEEELSDLDEYDISYYFNFTDDQGKPLQELDISIFDEEAYQTEEEAEQAGELKTFHFTDTDNDGKVNIVIKTDLTSFEGRSLVAQYPQSSDIESLYVMRDYKDQNDKIVTMWENVKANPLPVWVVVLLVIFLVGVFAYLGSYKLIRKYKVKKRKQLRKEIENS